MTMSKSMLISAGFSKVFSGVCKHSLSRPLYSILFLKCQEIVGKTPLDPFGKIHLDCFL